MTETGPAFGPDAYVVRFGGRAMLSGTACLAGGLAIIAFVVTSEHKPVVTLVIAWIVAVVLLGLGIFGLGRVVRRTVAFAVHPGGVFFGSGRPKDDVPWGQICAVEFFTEIHTTSRSQNKYRCVGVRSLGTRQTARPGNGEAAQPWPQASIQYMIDAGRPDLIPGADGTIRCAYRQMSGWRADPAQVAAAVARHAPGVPVIKGPDFPPAVTRAEAFAARRNRRAGGF